MKQYDRKGLNIKRLLALGILDIRGVAAKNGALSANEYFSKVERFIEDAPKFSEILKNASNLEEHARTLKEMEAKLGIGERALDFTKDSGTLADLNSLKTVLTEIGCDKIALYIEAICLALQNGNLKQAEEMASETVAKLASLFNSLQDVYTAQAGDTADSGGGVSLKEALEYFDYEEQNRKLRILAVDDVSVILNMLMSVLSPHYEVFALKDSSQVPKFLTFTTPELFLLDIEMSGVNGFDLVPLIRQFEEHKDTPIIFLTGNASYDNLKDAVALGACDFISKPVDKDILLGKIEKSIVRKRAY